MMRYKEYLSRTGQPLTPRKRGEEIYEEAEEAEDEEDKIRMLEWEQEWWQKVDAKLLF
jgi:DNA-binding transcriptional LysR family regulator